MQGFIVCDYNISTMLLDRIEIVQKYTNEMVAVGSSHLVAISVFFEQCGIDF